MTDTLPTPEVECTQEDFVVIRDFIHEKSGIYFSENKMYLVRNRLTRRLQELQMKSLRDYFYHVKYDTSMREFQQLMNLITTNETSFFRNEPQLVSFAQEALPQLLDQRIRNKETKILKVWSAGCSTGEEPYTLAIQLLEAFRTRPGWSCEIIANDISEDVLAKARVGEYSGITLRNIPQDLIARYFTKTADGVKVNQDVKSLVKFSHLNLNEPRKLALFSGMDVIFCRNVMIYFSEEVKKQIVRGFYAALRPGGYFYIGHSESMHGISKSFKLVYFKNALVYQKEANEPVATSLTSTLSPASTITRERVSTPGVATTSSRALDLLKSVKAKTPTTSGVGGR